MATRLNGGAKSILVLLFAVALIFAGKAATVTMPYRLSYWEGVRFYRWLWIWFGASAGAIGCAALWIGSASTRRDRIGGLFAVVAVAVLFFFAHPTWVHSISSAKNICIEQLREKDAAKDQWAE